MVKLISKSKEDKAPKPPKPVYARIEKPKVKQIRLPGPDDFNLPSNDFSNYTSLIYGGKGAGKTSATASFPKSLNIQFEPRRKNVKLRMYSMTIKRAREIKGDEDDPWLEFIEVNRQAIADPTIQTIAWDSVDLAYECCQEHVCRLNGIENPAMKKDYGATWNDIKFTFMDTIKQITDSNKSLVFISHAKSRESEVSDLSNANDVETLVGPSCASACLKILKQVCDFWFYYAKVGEKRVLYVRDFREPRLVDVSCGCGFMKDGEPIEKIVMPSDPLEFYPTLDKAFRGIVSGPKKIARKVK
jgi:hypothetical protein